MSIDLKAIEERITKAKEEAAFWETARAVLADPRLKAIADDDVKPGNLDRMFASAAAGSYGELRKSVLDALPDSEAGIFDRVTTQQIVKKLRDSGFKFISAKPPIAVNGALVALEEKGLAESVGRRGNAKLWRKKRQKAQEAPEGG